MWLKKIVVVVSSKYGASEVFCGNDLEVFDTHGSSSVGKLVIKRRDEKEALAVFSVWEYYYREEDESLDKEDEDEYSPDKDAESRIVEKKPKNK